MTPLSLKPLKPSSWDRILNFCKEKDVEAGETADFMYSVRSKTGVLTIWSQAGWKSGYYLARVTPRKNNDKLKFEAELGDAPPTRAWDIAKLEYHLRELISRFAPDERPR